MAALSDIEAAHARHRAALLAREAAEQKQLVASYAKAIRGTEAKLLDLADEIERLREQGVAPELLRGKLVREARLEQILDELRYKLAEWTDSITPEVEALHEAAVQRGIAAAEDLTRLGMQTPPAGMGDRYSQIIGQAFASVDHGAVENAVAYSHGGPVRELLSSLAGEAAENVAQEMAGAIARGQNPLVTARRIRSAISTPLYRAQTITRTETLRAYREATRETYSQSNLVDSWVWVAACDSRTCGACWALHGETFPTAEKMGTHPRCRCTMAPNTKSWEELSGLRQPGVEETNLAANMETGPELFAKLPESQQLAILGPSKFAAYRDGRISLGDLVQVDESSVWGTTRREKSLRAIVGDDRAKAYARMARTPPTPSGVPDGVGGVITEDEIDLAIKARFTPEVIAANPIEDLRRTVIESIRESRGRAAAADRLGGERLAAGRISRLDDVVTSTVAREATPEMVGAVRDAEKWLTEEFDLDPDRLVKRIEWRGISGNTHGRYYPGTQILQLDPRGRSVEEVVETFLHEFGHHLDYAYGRTSYLGATMIDEAKPILDALKASVGNRISSGLRDVLERFSAPLYRRFRTSIRDYARYLQRDREYLARITEQHLAIRYYGSEAFFRRYEAIPDEEMLYGVRHLNREEYPRMIPLIEAWFRAMGIRP